MANNQNKKKKNKPRAKKQAQGNAQAKAKKTDEGGGQPTEPRAPKNKPAKRQTFSSRREQARVASKRKTIIVVAAGVLILAAAIALPILLSEDEIGVTESDAFDLPALESDLPDPDGRLELADYAGKPLIVNFFASWCTACEAELPRFKQAATELEDELEIIFVNANETGRWRPMAERTGILDQPIAKDINGSNGNGLYRSLGGTGGMPITAFYSAEGELIDVDFGELSGQALLSRLQTYYQLGLPA